MESAAMGNWISYRLSQPGGNRDAIGAVVETEAGDRTTRQESQRRCRA